MNNTKKSRIICGKFIGCQLRRSIHDEEVKKLEDEIKKAYTLKALYEQLAVREANRMSANIQAKIVNEITRYHVDSEIEKHNRIVKTKYIEDTNKLKAELKRQINKKCDERHLLKEEERKERLVLIKVDQLREKYEELNKMHNKEQLAEQVCLESLLQSELREIDKHKLEELEVQESLKNMIYLEELTEREKLLVKQKQDMLKKREQTIEAVAKALMEIKGLARERQRLMDNLVIEEIKFEVEIEEKEIQLQRKLKMRVLAKDLQDQIRFEDKCRRRFLEREKEFANAVMIKVMESEKMERSTIEIRKQRRLQCREELEHLMKERECTRIKEQDKLRRAVEEKHLMEQAERLEAKKSRMLLLEKHIDKVANFINRKSLYDEEQVLVKSLQPK